MSVDDRSERAIATLHPKVQPLARQLVLDAAAKDIEIRITSGTRTYDEQNALYEQGRSKPGRIVTNARAGYSNHNFGLAIDVTVFQDGKPVWESPQYKTLGNLGKALGFAWGGDWQFQDEPHFELRPEWARDKSEKDMLTELRRRHDAGLDAFGGTTHPVAGTPKSNDGFLKTRQPVGNRGEPSTEFLVKLVQWARNAPREIFHRKDDPKPPDRDIYSIVKPILGPWRGDRHRIAVGMEVLRVLAGRESSWKLSEGEDKHNPEEIDDETMSAGMFQNSYNSRHFGQDLKDLLASKGITNGKEFREAMMTDFDLGCEYTMRLLRHTHRHHGPVKRGEIDEFLKADAVAEFEAHLA